MRPAEPYAAPNGGEIPGVYASFCVPAAGELIIAP